MMRILWVSNAPWTRTGYGVQTGLNTRSIRELGHDVAIFAYYGLDGAISTAGGMMVYPGGPTPWGNDLVRGHAQQFEADLVISLMDVWVQDFWGRKLGLDGRRFAPWLPVDQSPAPAKVVERLDGAAPAIAMSRFGEGELRAAGVEDVGYVPHCFDGGVFRPGDKAAARRALGLPEDRFIVGMVMANKGDPGRKCFPEQLLGFLEFKRREPRAWLYLHTLMHRVEGGVDLEALCKAIGLREGEDYGSTNAYEYVVGWNEQRLAQLYQGIDVLCNASMGEGFGVPILEAQACGTPVVTTGVTSMPELTWGGVCVERVHPFWTPLHSWAYMPDPEGVGEALGVVRERLLGDGRGLVQPDGRNGQDGRTRTDTDGIRERARAGAVGYERVRVRDGFWGPLLDGIAAEVGR